MLARQLWALHAHGECPVQVRAVEPEAHHIIIADQAGFHLPPGHPQLPEGIRWYEKDGLEYFPGSWTSVWCSLGLAEWDDRLWRWRALSSM